MPDARRHTRRPEPLMLQEGGTYAKVIADSVGPTGDRVTSFEIRFHRFVLAELNTHCVTGDAVLEFDMPTPRPQGRVRFKMTLGEFVDKWQNGSAPRRNKGGRGTNRQPLRQRLGQMRIRQLDEQTGLVQTTHVVDARSMGQRPTIRLTLSTGKTLTLTADHRVYTPDGYVAAGMLQPGDEVVVKRFGKREGDLLDNERLRRIGGVWRAQWQREQRARLLAEHGGCQRCGSMAKLAIHHVVPVHVDQSLAFDKDNILLLCSDCHHADHHDQSTYKRGGTYLYGAVASVIEVEDAGVQEVFDLEVAGPWHNFLANGVVVHNCAFARNSASSRAIPAAKQLERYLRDPAWPISWPAEQPGMQGGAELTDKDLHEATRLFQFVHGVTARAVRNYLKDLQNDYPGVDENGRPVWLAHALHKSVLNRLLEPLQWHTALVTAATYGNFFDQRCSPNAQPELRAVAVMMKELYDRSEPRTLGKGQWHLPYVHEDEEVCGRLLRTTPDNPEVLGKHVSDAREVCSARCARLSYLTQDGRRDWTEDLRLYGDLVSKWHWSPLEHVASPDPYNVLWAPIYDPDTDRHIADRRVARIGKFPGFVQWRHVVEGRQGYVSQR